VNARWKQAPERPSRRSDARAELLDCIPVQDSPGDIERDRVVAALIRVLGTRGYAGVTAEAVCAEAEIEIESFNRRFRDLADCVDPVWDEMSRDLISRMWSAYVNERSWRDGLRAAAYLVLRYFTEDDVRSRFFLIEILTTGEVATARRDRLFQLAVDLVDLGRYDLENPDGVPRAHAEAIVGAIYERLNEGVREGNLLGDGGVVAVRELMYVAVRPYFGHEAALAELTMPPPPEIRGASTGAR
jgi:AcrR family transcriptional regulator